MNAENKIEAVLKMYEKGISLQEALKAVTTDQDDIKKWVEIDLKDEMEKIRYRHLKIELIENIEQLKKTDNVINYAYQLSEDVSGLVNLAEDVYDIQRIQSDMITLKTLLYYIWEASDEK